MPELKPCPFCGETALGIENNEVGDPEYERYQSPTCFWVFCKMCGSSGSESDDEEAAIAAWNKRAAEGKRESCRCAKRAAKTDEEIIEAVSKDMENILLTGVSE